MRHKALWLIAKEQEAGNAQYHLTVERMSQAQVVQESVEIETALVKLFLHGDAKL
jgi:hypothetical protein